MVILPTLTLGPSFTLKTISSEAGRDLAHVRIDGGELPAALGQEFFEHDRGPLHLIRIVLRLHRKTYLALLKAVQDFGDGDRLGAFVLMERDYAPLSDDKGNDEAAVGPGLGFESDIVEAAAVPKVHEVAAQSFFVVDIALLTVDQGTQGIRWDAARTLKSMASMTCPAAALGTSVVLGVSKGACGAGGCCGLAGSGC